MLAVKKSGDIENKMKVFDILGFFKYLLVGSINSFLAILIGLSSRLLCEARAHSELCNRVTSNKMPTKLQNR